MCFVENSLKRLKPKVCTLLNLLPSRVNKSKGQRKLIWAMLTISTLPPIFSYFFIRFCCVKLQILIKVSSEAWSPVLWHQQRLCGCAPKPSEQRYGTNTSYARWLLGSHPEHLLRLISLSSSECRCQHVGLLIYFGINPCCDLNENAPPCMSRHRLYVVRNTGMKCLQCQINKMDVNPWRSASSLWLDSSF